MAEADGGLPEGAPPPPVGAPGDAELTNEFGVFVAANGTADGDGTKEHPLASIAAGIARVKDLKLRVYVCAGTYDESLTLVNAVSVIGSLGCDGGVWKTGGARSILQAPTSPAVRAKGISDKTRFEGFDVNAPAGTAMSPSSIALIAENAPMLTVASSKLTAGKAFDGVDGADGTQLTLAATAKGVDGLGSGGPGLVNPLKPVPYQYGSAGGVGGCVGAAGHDGENGGSGGNGATEYVSTAVVMGNTIYFWSVYNGDIRTDAVAHANTPGAAGSDGASAATIGTFSTTDGYVPKAGTVGNDGSPGKGGTGGNGGQLYAQRATADDQGKYVFGASGPGGGAGGCPGLAGKAGGGGGASIAALVFASAGMSLVTTELVAGAGGNGGKGTFGSQPTVGGAPGARLDDATTAANGGAGGRAGFSGNGAGGPSIALAYTGGEISVAQDTHLTPGTAGAAVPARSRTDALGNVVTIPASPTGPAMATLAF